MKPADRIKRLIQESEVTSGSGADARILGDALDQLHQRRQDTSGRSRLHIWRTLMTGKTGKLAVAAAVVLAALLGLPFLSSSSSVTWADVVQPILNANTAVLDLIIGDEDSGGPIIHDMIMGSRIRRTLSTMDDEVSIIDLKASRILTLSFEKKKAQFISLEGFPSIPNYLEHLKNVITTLQDDPHFPVEELGEREIAGQTLLGFRVQHPKVEVTIWADPETGLPVRIEQAEGQMRTICRDVQFDVPMEDALFSMEVPEGYTLKEESTLDLMGATEADFIEGLRVLAEVFGDGYFPEGVAVEDYLKQAPAAAEQIKTMALSEEAEAEIGEKIQNYLLFTRFFKGQGKWTYRGWGVTLGEKETPIFWYQPEDSETFRVIYGDLHVEDVAPENLPEPVSVDEAPEKRVGYQMWSKPYFVGTQEDYWYVLSDGRARVKAYLTLVKGPQDTSLLSIELPYADAPLEAVLLEREPLAFRETGVGAYDIELPLDKLLAGQTTIICQWHMSLEDLEDGSGIYRTVLQGLIPVTSYELKVGVDPQSGFELTKETSGKWFTPFTKSGGKPGVEFGSCGLAIRRHR